MCLNNAVLTDIALITVTYRNYQIYFLPPSVIKKIKKGKTL